jgi:hypothetical protein
MIRRHWHSRSHGALASVILCALVMVVPRALALPALDAENEKLFQVLKQERGLSDAQIQRMRAIFAASGYMGQGNPEISRHPISEAQCAASLNGKHIDYANSRYERICGAKYMAPLFQARRQKPEEALACIDQFEFPNVPCKYPVVWVKAQEAAEICDAEGERLCDAHEWEGACAGSLEPPDYPFETVKGMPPVLAIERMRTLHNAAERPRASWSYGPAYRPGICATGSFTTPGCPGGGWNLCGSNTYPTGSFPDCKSPLDVYDLNGNAAEHMNLPLDPTQMSSSGSKSLGYTEMKGSWFIFDTYRAHEDWCRWRAPFWHGTRVMDPHSHANYHLGFRCCKSVEPRPHEPAVDRATAPAEPSARSGRR